VNIDVAVEIFRQAELMRARADVAHRGLRDSCITSPSFPVGVRRPLPSMMAASVDSTEPPTSVQARPVVKPISFCFSSQNSRYFRMPRKSLTLAGVISALTALLR